VAEIYSSLLSRYYNSAGTFAITNFKAQFLAYFPYFEKIKVSLREHIAEREGGWGKIEGEGERERDREMGIYKVVQI
jgi:hypothetical protein